MSPRARVRQPLLREAPAALTAAGHVQLQWTPLHGAAAAGHVAVATLLLDRGAAVDARNHVRAAPYLSASLSPSLLSQPPPPHPDSPHCCPVELMPFLECSHMHRCLLWHPLQRRRSLRPLTAAGRVQYQRTPLHEAAYYGHAAVATLLLDRGAAVDAREKVRAAPPLSASLSPSLLSHPPSHCLPHLMVARLGVLPRAL